MCSRRTPHALLQLVTVEVVPVWLLQCDACPGMETGIDNNCLLTIKAYS